jgi:hypothetical protein
MKSGEVSIHNARAGVSSQFTVFPTVTRPLFGPLRNNPNDAYLLVDPRGTQTRLVCHSSTDHCWPWASPYSTVLHCTSTSGRSLETWRIIGGGGKLDN